MSVSDIRHSREVALFALEEGEARYAVDPPFLPGKVYPEFWRKVPGLPGWNPAYPLVRGALALLGLDRENFETPGWNPLGELIKPGDRVLIKPNLVRHLHLGGGDYSAVVTHPSIIRCVADYAALALSGEGEMVIGDAPVQGADFRAIRERNFLDEIADSIKRCWGIPCSVKDFRLSAAVRDGGFISGRVPLDGDDEGYQAVNLGEKSLLVPIEGDSRLFRVTNYPCGETAKRHSDGRHEYLIPNTVLSSDVVISLPKLKTHRKVGLTACMKNLVGINGHKDWLPHHREGSVGEGGDEYPNPSASKRLLAALAGKMDEGRVKCALPASLAARALSCISSAIDKDPYTEGSWYGNDTLWRTVLDLNRALIYAGQDGTLGDSPVRRTLNIVDAIISGEGEGPMEPTPRRTGFVAAGLNPLAVDTVLAALIGFDYRRIPLIANGFVLKCLPVSAFGPPEVNILSNRTKWRELDLDSPGEGFGFVPSSGWLGHIEAARALAE